MGIECVHLAAQRPEQASVMSLVQHLAEAGVITLPLASRTPV
jgi:hypothetical protein